MSILWVKVSAVKYFWQHNGFLSFDYQLTTVLCEKLSPSCLCNKKTELYHFNEETILQVIWSQLYLLYGKLYIYISTHTVLLKHTENH